MPKPAAGAGLAAGVPPLPPTAAQVKKLRQKRGQTQRAAAESIGVTLRRWQRFAADAAAVCPKAAASMSSPVWELYLLDSLHAGVALPEPFAGYLRRRWPGFGKKKQKKKPEVIAGDRNTGRKTFRIRAMAS